MYDNEGRYNGGFTVTELEAAADEAVSEAREHSEASESGCAEERVGEGEACACDTDASACDCDKDNAADTLAEASGESDANNEALDNTEPDAYALETEYTGEATETDEADKREESDSSEESDEPDDSSEYNEPEESDESDICSDETDESDTSEEPDEPDDSSEYNEPEESDESDICSDETDESESSEESSDTSTVPAEYDFRAAEARLLTLQQRARELKIPVVVVFEGWSAAGKGDMAGELLEGLDPRGYDVYVHEREESNGQPPLGRYWVKMPKAGDTSVFIGSWYHDACAEAVGSRKGARGLDARLERINLMERMLICDGVLILKFFINISQKEQKRRLKALEARKLTRVLVSKADKAQNGRYDEWRGVYNHMLAATGEAGAEWRVLAGKSRRECKRRMYTAVISAFERAIALRESGERPWDTPELGGYEPIRAAHMPPLCDYETERTLDEPYKQAMDGAKKRLRELQYELYRKGIPMVIAFEGWDAAGKGGAIRRISSALDARGFTVVPISAPTPDEKAHHHLWRFWRKLPKAGHITIFDRSWYGRVMVERIEGFCTENQWRRAYEELNLFERDITESGAIVLKLWLQISNGEQLRRFIARRDDPAKRWKITDEDWRNREKWQQYEEAVNDMLQKTSTREAPWIVIEGDNKQFARLKALNSVIAAIEARLR